MKVSAYIIYVLAIMDEKENNGLEQRMTDHGIRPTALRLLIARELLNAKSPLSGGDIEQLLETVDRSTITRAISLFCEKGFVHVIKDGSDSCKYELCKGEGAGGCDDLHVHFHCERCGHTECLPDLLLPGLALPEGYVSHSASYVVSGLCADCAKRSPQC